MIAIFLLTAFFMVIIYYMNQKANELTITEEIIQFPKRINEKTFLFLTDLHRRVVTSDVAIFS